jgi:PhnB protein
MLNPCLFFKGNAEEVLEHYRAALGGDVTIARFEDTPACDEIPTVWRSKVAYGALNSPLGLIAAMDAPPGRQAQDGDNFSIAVQAGSETDTDAIWARLAAGGTVQMPLEKTFFAEKFGMLTDRFGVRWMIGYGQK